MSYRNEPGYLTRIDDSGNIRIYTEREVRRQLGKTKEMVDNPKSTWTTISSSWKKEDYKFDVESWKERKQKIVEDKTLAKEICKRCETMWSEEGNTIRYKPNVIIGNVIIRHACHSCDRTIQPYVSNPKNRDLVLEYIPEEFHEVIFE